MRVVIITAAGISSRFNEGIREEEKCLKIIYFERNRNATLLYHLLEKCKFADQIVLVGGYKYNELEAYCEELPDFMKKKLILVYNEHYADLASGYSLYVGLKTSFESLETIKEVLFIEGDLDIDRDSFNRVVNAKHNVLTYNFEPIYAKKAVVFYRNIQDHFRYMFNSSHGLLRIDEAFSLILNSGQMWKFIEIEKLKAANKKFYQLGKEGTNLGIIQNYIDSCAVESFELVGLYRWTNCNTREDYRKIAKYWVEE